MLRGRAAERSVIDGLLASARAGCSGVLVIRGEPGIGKTALLDYAACRAGVEGVRVLRGAGVESETELPFAGLHLLLGSALERCSALPPPQRDALDAAFGLRHAGPDDGLLVGLAVLSLLAGLAGDGRLVCLVDDAHWLDRPSAQALVFAARRLHREGIAVVVAAGDHHRPFPAPGLPELRLGGLDAAAAAALLGEHGAGLPAQVRDRVLAQARGNPLGLIELPAAYRDGLVPAAGPGPAAGLGLTDRLRQAFGGQVRRLPEPTQTLLLVAAAQGSGELAVVLAAAATLGVAAADLGPAERAGLVVVADGTVRFRHPLVAAAVYQGAVLSRRQGVHRALADAWRGLADADRRAWHLAAAAPGPDEQAAAALEGAAAKAIAAGGYAAAAAAAQRAVQLTADPAAHARRLTLAAQAAAETGELDGARRLAERAAAHTTDPVLQARLAGVRAVADFAQGRLNTAHRLLVEGAARIGGPDPPLGRWSGCWDGRPPSSGPAAGCPRSPSWSPRPGAPAPAPARTWRASPWSAWPPAATPTRATCSPTWSPTPTRTAGPAGCPRCWPAWRRRWWPTGATATRSPAPPTRSRSPATAATPRGPARPPGSWPTWRRSTATSSAAAGWRTPPLPPPPAISPWRPHRGYRGRWGCWSLAAAAPTPRWPSWRRSRGDRPATTRRRCAPSPTWSRPRSGSASRSGPARRWPGSPPGPTMPTRPPPTRWSSAATRWSRRAGTPSGTISPRSGCTRSASNRPAPSYCTARGCAAAAARPTPAPSCAPRWTPWTASTPRRGPPAPAPSWAPPAPPSRGR